MTATLLSLTLIAGLATGQFAPQQAGSAPLEPALEARVQKLGKELRCPMCQGLSIADSSSSAARAQLDKVRELVADGRSDQEVRDFFVARYGEWALLEPKAEGFNWLVWLGPLLLIVGGLFVILRQVKGPAAANSGEAPAPVPESPATTAAEAEDPYLQAVRREMEQ
ncbi:cytochrome c-type biogenesis protein [Stigmatella aurantiaca]|uniref:Cytochrome c-type biogenesis protein n=1 Tax=Stigmatella aurantiaca (strain DW4/3-1) TaxID=378806 RepID=Q098B1_STIAD|nr:cytochrome c-type biogenesis protein [Stigmatella aurantiaca]ADO71475.1 Cytochrome c-type biogenesis protein [Stigmatella aurantiaca DW4/3-1]EAU68092.1 cytochrome C-type biogenesis protein CcmH [Stigmatella aurantiaca DW4/3-1]